MHMDIWSFAGSEKRCRFLIIGITNYDIHSQVYQRSGAKPISAQANPFTFYERMMMITESMAEAGVAREEFSFLPIEMPEKIASLLPQDVVFRTIYADEWG